MSSCVGDAVSVAFYSQKQVSYSLPKTTAPSVCESADATRDRVDLTRKVVFAADTAIHHLLKECEAHIYVRCCCLPICLVVFIFDQIECLQDAMNRTNGRPREIDKLLNLDHRHLTHNGGSYRPFLTSLKTMCFIRGCRAISFETRNATFEPTFFDLSPNLWIRIDRSCASCSGLL